MDELSKVINIGKVLEGQLEQVGIKTLDKLKKVGSKKTWLEIRVIDKSAWINKLYALEGAIQGIKKKDLSCEVKSDLKEFYKSLDR